MVYEWKCKVGNTVREIWAICNVGIISDDKTITWYDLWCAFIVETAHLFGCFEFSHQSWCPHLHFARKQKPFFVNPKHLKNLRRNRPNLTWVRRNIVFLIFHCVELRKFPWIKREFSGNTFFFVRIYDNLRLIHDNSCSQAQRLKFVELTLIYVIINVSP